MSSQRPPSYASLKNIPFEPRAPSDRKDFKFRAHLHSLAKIPLTWENPGLLDEALRSVPLDIVSAQAEDEFQIFQAEANGRPPRWGYADCLVRALMTWFKRSFFQWINNPPCGRCQGPTVYAGRAQPTDDELARCATSVEAYQCSQCGEFERFPRYSDAFVLMQTRRGRMGEWANCFGMLCRAMGARVRWVFCLEDKTWVEIYSEHQRRWVHVDVVEQLWDNPRVYTEGRSITFCAT